LSSAEIIHPQTEEEKVFGQGRILLFTIWLT
jgi:hypothetical protein